MALTRDFRDTIRLRAQRDPAFRQGLLREGMELILNGDFATGRSILRNYINATIGFSELARVTGIPSPSLQRMFGPSGNPRAENLFNVIGRLQREEGIGVELQVRRGASQPAREILLDQTRVKVSPHAHAAFQAGSAGPSKPNSRLIKSLATPAAWE